MGITKMLYMAKCDAEIAGTGVLDCPFGVPILPSGKGSGGGIVRF